MRTPEFAAFVAPSRHTAQLWRLFLGIGLILFVYLAVVAMMVVVMFPITGPFEYFGWLQGLPTGATPGHVIFLLLTFIGMGLGPIIAAPACHARHPGTLFGPAGDTARGFFQVLMVLIPLQALGFLATWKFFEPLPNLPLGDWLRFLPLALPLVLIQTSAEEILFRGYLQQQLAARFAARWVWMGLPALIFTAGHWSPEAGNNAWGILIAIMVFALIAADLTEQTGSLGAAMGLHFCNNVMAMLVVSMQGSISGLALFITPFTLADSEPIQIALAVDVVMMLIIWRILRHVVTR
ncbi:CPBP family intramembrane glutamic endopeptidase [Actibacterium sp. XHP0104]|uniref:CPBP family intramembrane glutamic endopeptidase n=1 Tax=Actibacterium sp. XHP0104 TaxID=2984335 RepID=UPI0021E95830|nr:CPBP family intramembrane glutamic endopeptidase [Actibacterium sp. XHP0104]MCV2881669.1 CPBP family intramembrane metalloprotease [Actibacterium sp. XHP0104]